MKNVAKKLLCLVLAIMLPLSLVACGQTAPAQTDGNDPALVKFVDENGKLIVDSFEGSFESGSGMQCDTSIRVEGTAIVIDCKIEGLDDIPEELGDQIQAVFDESEGELKASFEGAADEFPDSLTAIVINMCEEDGDKIAVIDLQF